MANESQAETVAAVSYVVKFMSFIVVRLLVQMF
jgi:hypothetical protein